MCRLDAGTFGTMGVGLGFAIAAATVERNKGDKGRRIVCVEGDSAFGFSGMEVETMCRWVGTPLSTKYTHLTHLLFLNDTLYLFFFSFGQIHSACGHYCGQ